MNHHAQLFEKPPIEDGETYIGIIGCGEYIKPYHLILLPFDRPHACFISQKRWARRMGGNLPNIIEAAMLRTCLGLPMFHQAGYWLDVPIKRGSYEKFYNKAMVQWVHYPERIEFVSALYGFRAKVIRRVYISVEENT